MVTVTLFLQCLTGCVALQRTHAVADEAVVGLNAFHRSDIIVDKAKTNCLATTKLRFQAEDRYLVLIGDLVQLGQLLNNLRLRNSSIPGGVVDHDCKLFSVQQFIISILNSTYSSNQCDVSILI